MSRLSRTVGQNMSATYRTITNKLFGLTRKPRVSLDDLYIAEAPSAQNVVNLVSGWVHDFPAHLGVVANAQTANIATDYRVDALLEFYGSIKDRSILELGPLEGSLTFLLDQHEPAVIYAVEANKEAYLRCLIVKELLDIKRAKFRLGNFIPMLENEGTRYDIIFASGVLYHLRDPVRLLKAMSRRTDVIYLWTHYIDEVDMPKSDPRRWAFLDETEMVDCEGLMVRQHLRSYHGAWKLPGFSGGIQDTHAWLEPDTILEILRHLGFDDIHIDNKITDQPGGPSISIFARRAHPTMTE